MDSSGPHEGQPRFDGGITKVTLVLADAATVAEGKLNVLGGGWTFTGPQPCPFAIAGIIEVPWHLANERHTFRLELLDLDGQPVEVPTPDGDQPPIIDGEFEVGRPAGVKPGTSISFPFAVNSGPVPLPPGGHFEWRLTINGTAREDWRLPFSTRQLPPARAA